MKEKHYLTDILANLDEESLESMLVIAYSRGYTESHEDAEYTEYCPMSDVYAIERIKGTVGSGVFDRPLED